MNMYSYNEQDRFATCFKTRGTGLLFRGGVGVQSPFDAIALQTVTLLAMHVCIYQTSGTSGAVKKSFLNMSNLA